MVFYHNKGIDMLKLGFTLPNLVIICNRKSTNHKSPLFAEIDTVLLDKILDDMTCLREEAVVDQTYNRNSEMKSILGNIASQLYLFSICHEKPTGF